MLHNYMDFVDLKVYLTLAWEVSCDGAVLQKGVISAKDMPSVNPHTDAWVNIPATVPEKGRCYLRVIYLLKNATELLPAGHVLGFDEILLKNYDGRNQEVLALREKEGSVCNTVSVTEDPRHLTISGDTFQYVFSKLTGVFVKMDCYGSPLITHPMEINIWRAPTDNDRKLKLEWIRAFYDQAATRTYATDY